MHQLSFIENIPVRPWDSKSTAAHDWTLHQVAPYIGRMKTTMARALIQELTSEGDLVVDPFCGSGVVPLEAAALGRVVEAGDLNPYAYVITMAKLFPPNSMQAGLDRLDQAWAKSLELLDLQDLRTVPLWVRAFFHPETLRHSLALRDACIELNDFFILANLLGILHHQRPGFLSYPSSNLIPYLRDRKYPRADFPEMYSERDVLPRMIAKVARTLQRLPPLDYARISVRKVDARRFPLLSGVKAVITSPPYMNSLDYVRDNRLRLWFIEKKLENRHEFVRRAREKQFAGLLRGVVMRFNEMIDSGGYFALVLGDARRGGSPRNTAKFALSLFSSLPLCNSWELVQTYEDEIPIKRRARKEIKQSIGEQILIFHKR